MSSTPSGEALEAIRPHQELPAWVRWTEVVGLTAFAILIGPIVNPADPLFLGRRFPWPAMVPLVLALRYGSLCGLASGGALALAAVAWSRGAASPVPEWALGWLLVAFAAGLFRDAWARRTRTLEVSGEERRLRLDGLVRAHRTLEASHDRLQRSLPGQPGSLRDSLDAVRRMVQGDQGNRLEAMAGRILELFEELAHVHAASVHPVDAQGRAGPALAASGGCADAETDALVLEAVSRRVVVSVRDADADGGTGLLAAIPLVDVEDRVRAVVAVREMPFVALHPETLHLFAVLGGALGDALAGPSSTDDFRQRLRRAAVDASRYGVPAVVARVRIEAGLSGRSAALEFAAGMVAHRRSSDQVLVLGELAGKVVLAVLLRPAGVGDTEGYRRRLAKAAAEQGCEVDVRAWYLAGSGAQRVLQEAEAVLSGSDVVEPVTEKMEVELVRIPSPARAVRS